MYRPNSNGDNTPSSSRARMLAQQREIQMKKRQSSMMTGGYLWYNLFFMRWMI